MGQALALARQAQDQNEVPIGCVVVKDGQIIGQGYNLRETAKSATRHAEMIAIEAACEKLGAWRLLDCDLYVTLEPCLMCAGAIYQARIRKVYFGAYDPKAGAVSSLYQVHQDVRLNHNFEAQGGVMEIPCSELLQTFFHKKRLSK